MSVILLKVPPAKSKLETGRHLKFSVVNPVRCHRWRVWRKSFLGGHVY